MNPPPFPAWDLIHLTLILPLLDTTGNESSARGIIDVYDIFGLMPPTLQGADRLAESLDAVVLVPDFFKGEPLSLGVVPSDTAEKKTIVQKFMAEKANPFEVFPSLFQTATEAKEKYPNVQGWGVFGLCWGGKVRVSKAFLLTFWSLMEAVASIACCASFRRGGSVQSVGNSASWVSAEHDVTWCHDPSVFLHCFIYFHFSFALIFQCLLNRWGTTAA